MGQHHDDDNVHRSPRGLGRRKTDQPKINWSAVSVIFAVSIYVVGSLTGFFGANAAEVRKISERLSILETQRFEDVRRMERIENKLDRILERVQ